MKAAVSVYRLLVFVSVSSSFTPVVSSCLCMCAVGKAVEMNKQRSPKQVSHPAFGIPEQLDSSASNSGRTRGNQLSEVSETGATVPPLTASSTHSSPTGQTSDTSGQDSDSSKISLFL